MMESPNFNLSLRNVNQEFNSTLHYLAMKGETQDTDNLQVFRDLLASHKETLSHQITQN